MSRPRHRLGYPELPDEIPLAVTGGIAAQARAWDLRDGAVHTGFDHSAYALAGLTVPDRASVVVADAEVLHVRELRQAPQRSHRPAWPQRPPHRIAARQPHLRHVPDRSCLGV